MLVLHVCVAIVSGVVHLIKEHKVCDLGQVLTPEQARILVGVID